VGLHIAILESEYLTRESLREWLVTAGHRVTLLEPAGLSRERLRAVAADVLILDVDHRHLSVGRALTAVRETTPDTCVILTASPALLSRAIRALEQGALDYVEKPLAPEKVNAVIRKALRFLSMRDEVKALRQRLCQQHELNDLLGHDHEIERITRQLDVIGQSALPVLITGERGTGKALLARIIHARHHRSDQAFACLDCGALGGDLLAQQVRASLDGFEATRLGNSAAPATLCFVGVDQLPSSDLALLERLTTPREDEPAPGDAAPEDLRVISTSRRDVDSLRAEGRLSEALLARIGVVRFHLPPLRSRGVDALLIAEHLLKRYNQAHDRAIEGFDPLCRQALLNHAWEGNVRELMAVVEQAVVVCPEAVIGIDHLPAYLTARPGLVPGGGPRTLREIEHHHILRVLTATQGNKSRAAQLLGINRATLYNRLKEMESE
jgi:two-component system, NtrC family, response regulator AtoC